VASVAAALCCCSSSSPPSHPDAAFLPKDVGLVVAETDGSPGGAVIETIDPSTHTLVQHRGTAFDEDPRLRRLVDPRTSSSRLFVVGAATGQLTELSRTGAIVNQWSVLDDGGVGQSASPRDVAIAPDGALWVTRGRKPGLRVLEPDGTPRRTVDLAAFAPGDAPADRSPGMTAIAIVGATAYVALARTSATSTLTNDAQVVSIDTTTYETKLLVDVPMRGPVDRFAFEAAASATSLPRLWLACAGDADPVTRRGLVAIDLDRKEVGTTLDWTTLGLSPIAFAIAGTHEGFAIATAPTTSGSTIGALVTFDPGTPGSVVQTIFRSPDAPRLVELVVANDRVMVAHADRASPGILFFDRFDGSRRGVLSTAAPPRGLVVLRPDS
jgi:hypothetical protein